jgi:predicted CoA-binding protein
MAVVFRAPEYTKEVLEDVKAAGISRVWFQPGAYDSSIGCDYSDGIEVFHDD